VTEKYNIRTIGQLVDKLSKYPRDKEFIFITEGEVLLPTDVREFVEGVNIICSTPPIMDIAYEVSWREEKSAHD